MILTPENSMNINFKAVDVVGNELHMDYFDTETREAHILVFGMDGTPLLDGEHGHLIVKTILPESIKVTWDE